MQSLSAVSSIRPFPAEVALESKVAFLRQPTSFPDLPYRVEAIETHMSWVFLTGQYAFKLKKPVCQDVLDFRTLAARRYYCNEEVRLNRRLAANVYLGVVALSLDARGHLHLGHDGNGEHDQAVVDWLVQMRRLPARWMLDYAIRNGALRDDDIRRIAHHLAAFYAACEPVSIDAADYRAGFLHAIDRNQQILTEPAYGLPAQPIHGLCAAQRAVLQTRPDLFDARVRAGKIVEGHGDLRPEHICLKPEVAIIDCLEFSRALRLVDPADELAYLALECERLGLAQAGISLLRAYREKSGDRPDAALVRFYQGFRALLRAGIAIRHLDEERYRHSAEWHRRAASYVQLAETCQNASSAAIDPPV